MGIALCLEESRLTGILLYYIGRGEIAVDPVQMTLQAVADGYTKMVSLDLTAASVRV
jgi:hypothetical protein